MKKKAKPVVKKPKGGVVAQRGWKQTCHGLKWSNMPGSDDLTQKLNFALLRLGEVKLEELFEELPEGLSEEEPLEEGEVVKSRNRMHSRHRKMKFKKR